MHAKYANADDRCNGAVEIDTHRAQHFRASSTTQTISQRVCSCVFVCSRLKIRLPLFTTMAAYLGGHLFQLQELHFHCGHFCCEILTARTSPIYRFAAIQPNLAACNSHHHVKVNNIIFFGIYRLPLLPLQASENNICQLWQKCAPHVVRLTIECRCALSDQIDK